MRTKSEARRQAIIDVAKASFSRKGYVETSMSEIAALVGGSKATLYNYFRSKEEVFEAVMEESARGQFSEIFHRLDANADLAATLTAFGEHYLSCILRPEIMSIRRMAVHEADRSDIGRQYYANGPHRGWSVIRNYMARQMEQQRITTGDPWICAMHLKGLLESEILEPYALGVAERPADAELQALATRAVRVFLAAYAA